MEKQQFHDAPPQYAPSATFTGGKESNGVVPPGHAYPPQQGGYPQQNHYHQPVVVAQPVPVNQQIMGGTPPNHSTLAWLTCLFCCWPLGLIAIIKSRDVDSAADRGDIEGAKLASKSARKFGYCSLGFGIGSYVIAAIILVVYFAVLLPKFFSQFKGIYDD